MDGIINVYKERGMSSFDVCYKLRSILSEKKIGHTGTLDPMAEGVLVVCAGKATKLVDSISGGEKLYETELLLGLETDSEDTSGNVLKTASTDGISEAELREAILSMQGEYWQTPPMYSAKKQNGKRLYEMARKGQVVERSPSLISIYEIEILKIAIPRARLRIRCSKGTYIRTLCADIGKKLGCGAAMAELKRFGVGGFSVEKSLKLSELESLKAEGRLHLAVKPPVYIPEDTAVCFGKFDGGHRGHQLIFERLFREAKKKGLRTALLTFSQNPDIVVKGEHKPAISTPQEHMSRLKNLGFDYVFEFPMTKETMQITAEEFLREVLVSQMRAREIVVGTDCSFGYRAQGDAMLLSDMQDKLGYRLHVVEKLKIKDSDGSIREISSSLIKEKIALGEMELANKWLGRVFGISGVVVHGRHIGGPVLSFPTVNIYPTEGKAVPAIGVYVSRVLLDGVLYWGMTNVGRNPTISEGNALNIETYILDYEGDAYGKKIRVDFLKRLREEKRFSSIEELREQMLLDRDAVIEYREKTAGSY